MSDALPELATAGVTLVGGGAMLTEYAAAGAVVVVLGVVSYTLVTQGTRMRGVGS